MDSSHGAPPSGRNDPSCCEPRGRRWIDDHFSGSIRPQQEQRMRAHLTTCADCRAYYDRHLLLAQFDRRARPAEERIGRALGLTSKFGTRHHILWGLATATAAIAIFGVWTLLPLSPSDPGEFTPRGESAVAPVAKATVYVHRMVGAETAERVDQQIRRLDELAFAYVNPNQRRYALIFGVDETGRVFWYHPAWTDAKKNPTAVPLAITPGLHELPSATRHPLQGKSLRLYAIFLNRAVTVREVERRLKRVPALSPTLPFADAEQWTALLGVAR